VLLPAIVVYNNRELPSQIGACYFGITPGDIGNSVLLGSPKTKMSVFLLLTLLVSLKPAVEIDMSRRRTSHTHAVAYGSHEQTGMPQILRSAWRKNATRNGAATPKRPTLPSTLQNYALKH
jgi:hypothetical protein